MPLAPASEVVRRLRAAFDAGTTRPLEWRRRQLRMMARLLRDNQDDILDALFTDMRKPRTEAWMADVGHVVAEIGWIERNLERLTRDRRMPLALHLRPGRARVVHEPLGVVLVVAPWNYPVQLLLLPMAGAIAAGNAVVGKPSEVTAHTSATLARLWPRYLDSDAVALVEGGGEQTGALIDAHVDHVFYTGGARVAREVMAAAARHLTPVTLELGGKSPAIVDRDADLRVAARRIAWGRYLNAGQTCIAPDHVLVHRDVERALLDHLVEAVRSFYGDDPRRSPDFARIVNDAHVERLRRLLDAGGYEEVVVGGDVDAADRYVAPTILCGVREDAAVMQEEIFGPVLPVIAVDGVDAAIESVRSRPSPLAVYLFTRSRDTERRVMARTSSGGVSVNGGIVHAGVRSLPFGGVGESGMGAYHGRFTVDTFSHLRPVLRRPFRPDPSVPYPPYTPWKRRIVERFL